MGIRKMKIKYKRFLFLFIILCSVYLIYGWGWKLIGFKYCTDPNTLFVEDIKVSTDKVSLAGTTVSSADGYVGYKYKKEGDKLYIGLKYDILALTRQGSFDLSIDIDTQDIDQIYLLGGKERELIWNKSASK